MREFEVGAEEGKGEEREGNEEEGGTGEEGSDGRARAGCLCLVRAL